MTSASSTASAGVRTRRPSASALARLFEPSGRPMRTSTPESRRRQRVGVALAAVAEHRHVLALDQGQVGVVVVEHLSHGAALLRSVLRWSVCGAGPGRARPAPGGTGTGRRVRSVIERPPRPMATMPDCTSSRMPNGWSTARHAASLSVLPVTSMVTASSVDVDDLGLEQLDGVEHLPTGVGVRLHLDQQELAVDRRGAVELDDLDDLDQLVELLGHLLERGVVDRRPRWSSARPRGPRSGRPRGCRCCSRDG